MNLYPIKKFTPVALIAHVAAVVFGIVTWAAIGLLIYVLVDQPSVLQP